MAEEAVKFPGTELSLVEVVEKSWRLDHPNFGDVYKTTFAKGVIKDFQKSADDPIEVEPLVKVEVEGVGESEFIPLFFHPKALYWDAEDGVLAQDFDQEKGYFKRSWMSFRGDDEVVVMLKEGVPVAVLGFFDGLPRIGENILKMEDYQQRYPEDYLHYLNMDRHGEEDDEVDSSEKGPDGLDLGLKKEIELVDGDPVTVVEDMTYGPDLSYPPWTGTYWGLRWCNEGPPLWGHFEVQNPPGDQSGLAGYEACLVSPQYDSVGDSPDYAKQGYSQSVETRKIKVCVFPVVVGPILYAIYVIMENSVVVKEYCRGEAAAYMPEVLDWANRGSTGFPPWDSSVPPPLTGPVVSTQVLGTPDNYSDYDIIIKAGIYTDDLLERTIASVNGGDQRTASQIVWNRPYFGAPLWGYEIIDWWPHAPEELVLQEELTSRFNTYYRPAIENQRFYVRPHTKEELVEAGMWTKKE